MTQYQSKSKRNITRLAPSPTGALHLGNARTFLINWAIARQSNWHILLRIEDLDGPRIKPDAAESCMKTLAWLGIDWDQGPIIQSHDLSPYIQAMQKLAAAGHTYPSDLSRKDIEAAASAPQEGSRESRFPPDLRPAAFPRDFHNPSTSWRFAVPNTHVDFTDTFAGPQFHHPLHTIGDFIIWTKRGQPAYQLAVVVDDFRQGITHIIRGDDLLDSAARQLLLYRALGYTPEPQYTHLPLIKGEDGKRLAKRHGDTRIDSYQAQGVPAQAVIGLIAYWCGLIPTRTKLSAPEFAAGLHLDTIPRSPITFTAQDHAWLLSHAQ